MKKRLIGLVATAALAISATAAPAAAFDPPGDPAPHGDCTDGPTAVASFTGTNGHQVALGVASSPGAWSAVGHGPITLCD